MKKLKKNKNLFFFFSSLTILLIIAYGIYNNYSSNYNNLKMDKSKQFVYTKEKRDSGNYKQYIPYLNIKGENSELINNNIKEYINSFQTYTNIEIKYQYNINGKILSIILIVEDHSYVESATVLYFRSYNLNIETSEILSNDKVLSYFDLSENDIQPLLDEKIKNYYNSLVYNNLMNPDECNYNCFLQSRNFTNNTDDIEYYIKKGKLIAFKPYIFISLTPEEKITYYFEIAK